MNKMNVYFGMAVVILLFSSGGCVTTRECVKEREVEDTVCKEWDTKRGYCKVSTTISTTTCEEYVE